MSHFYWENHVIETYEVIKPETDALEEPFYKFLFGESNTGLVKLDKSITLFPFKIRSVRGRLNTNEYMSMISQLEIPMCIAEMRNHDLLNHILPLKYVVEHTDKHFMNKMKELIMQPGDWKQKKVDYTMLEFLSFNEAQKLANTPFEAEEKDISPILIKNTNYLLTTDQVLERWRHNVTRVYGP